MADNKDPVINEFMEGMKSYTGNTGTSPTFVDDSATTGFKEEVSPFIDEDTDATSANETRGAEDTAASTEAVDPNSEVVEVTIDGKVSRVKVDMNNKEQLRKAVVASVQAKHFMAQQKVQHAALAKQVEDLKDAHTSFGEVEKAFRSKGIEGLVDLMSNKEGAYKDFLQKQVQKEMLRRDASPAELERYELEERLETLQRSTSAQEANAKQHEASAKEAAVVAERTRIEGAIQPAFDKYRFAGELNNPTLEARMDKAIWTSAMDELKEFAAINGQSAVTSQVSNRIFSEISKEIKDAFKVQATKEATVSAETRKADAGFKVSAQAMAAQGSNNSRQDIKALYNKHVKSGNYAAAMALLQS